MPRPVITLGNPLPGDAQAKLELPWIKRRGRRARLGIEGIHVCHVEAVDQVKHVHDPLQMHALVKADALGHAHVGKDRHGPDTGISSQIAIQRAGK